MTTTSPYHCTYRIILCIVLFSFVSSVESQTSEKSYLSFEEAEGLKSSSTENNYKVTISHTAADHNAISFHTPGTLVYPIYFKQDTLHRLYIDGLTPFGEEGQPELPGKNIVININQGQTPEFEITHLDTITLDHINILPNTDPEAPLLDELQVLYPNPNYLKNRFYPENWIEIMAIQTIKNKSIAIVRINPVRFNPVTRQIKVARNLGFKWNQTLQTKSVSQDEKRPSYLILAPEQYRESAEKLLMWKKALGFNATLITNEQWMSSAIKSTVQSTFSENQNSLDYLLLIGDHEQMPAEERYREDDDEMKLFVTDLYYTCMDGDDDYLPDMAYGRLPASSSEEAAQLVDKIINYEQNPPSAESYYQTVIGCAQFQDDDEDGYADRRFIQTSEDVGDYLKTKNYDYKRVYFAEEGIDPQYYNDGKYASGGSLPDELLKKSGFSWDGGAEQIINAINAGSFFTFHRDHGLTSGMGWSHPEFTTEHIAQLDNPETPTILYSINCHSGKFNIPESFAEGLLLHPLGGAVAAFCATNTSYSGYNDAMFVAMVDAIWNDPGIVPDLGPDNYTTLEAHEEMTTLGDILNYGKVRMLEQWSGSMDTHQHIFELFHLLGDPAMQMPKVQPLPIDAAVPDWFSSNDIQLTIDNISCTNGIITLSANGTDIIHSQALSGETVNIPIPAAEADSFQLVIAGKGYLPYIKTIRKNEPLLSIPDEIKLPSIDRSTLPFNQSFQLSNIGKGVLNIDSINCSGTGLSVNLEKNIAVNESENTPVLLTIQNRQPGTYHDSVRVFINKEKHAIPVNYRIVTIANNTNGIWTKDHSPYLVSNTIEVCQGAELIIEAGVKVIFDQNAQLLIKGSVQALGTVADSITFTSMEGATGTGLQLSECTDETSTFQYCRFVNNKGNDTYSVTHIDNYPNVSFEHCLFDNNQSRKGGAVSVTESTASFQNCIFINNTANFGGALYTSDADLFISLSQFRNNKSDLYGGSGGAIYSKGSECLIEGSVFFNNYAAYAGAVYLKDNSSGQLVNNTFTMNLSSYGAGIRLKAESTAQIYNTILWNNEAFSSGKEIYTYDDCNSKFYNCIIKGGKDKIKVYKDNTFHGELSDCFDKDPLFTKHSETDFNLTPDSPGKNQGTANISNYQFPQNDLQGGERIRYGTIDIGAYEFQNYAPHDITLSCDSVIRQLGPHRFIGLISTADQDEDDTHTYTVSAQNNSPFFISNDSIYSSSSLSSLTNDEVFIEVKTTDSGFGNLTFEKRMALKLSDANFALTKSLSPVRTTNFPKDTLIHLSEYFSSAGENDVFNFTIGESTKSHIADASLNNDELNISYKDIGRTYLPLTVSNGNQQSSFHIAIEVWGPNAVNDEKQIPFAMYPNPAKKELLLSGDAIKQYSSIIIEIFDASGRKVHQQTLHAIQEPISVSHLLPGAYILKIITPDKQTGQQLFVKM